MRPPIKPTSRSVTTVSPKVTKKMRASGAVVLPQMEKIPKLDDAESNVDQDCEDRGLWDELEKVGESHDEEDSPYSMEDSEEARAGSCENIGGRAGDDP
jgi:hypothetical protein